MRGFLIRAVLVCIVVIALKLLKVIKWSWWAVLAPIWVPSVVVLVILATGVMIVSMRRK
jgi:hypothetical protein